MMKRLSYVVLLIYVLIGFALLMSSEGASLRKKRHSPSMYYQLQRRLLARAQERLNGRPQRDAGVLPDHEMDSVTPDRRPFVRGTRPSRPEGHQPVGYGDKPRTFFSEW